MSDAAAIVADLHRAISLLGEIDDAAAVRVRHALDAWLRGTTLEASFGLVPGWRLRVRVNARNHAVEALIKIHPGMADYALAKFIIDGIRRVPSSGIRPDGADGHLWDLKRAGCDLGNKQWCRAIADLRHLVK
jgi:hypothetical protein